MTELQRESADFSMFPMRRIYAVIEEDDDLRLLMTQYLESRGAHVLALKGPQDLTDLTRLQPDVVILDLVYHHEPIGLSILTEVKNTIAAVSVVVLTGDAELAKAHESTLNRHTAAVLLKPFDLDEFDRAIGIEN